MKYLINISYDGSAFYGFQKQKDKSTVASELERVLSKIFNEDINIVGASRTDRGVHAYNQFVHFESTKEIDINKLKHSMNSLIDGNIHIKNIKIVPNDFNARYDVKNKEYIYKINTGEYNPIEKNYIYQYNKKIIISLIKNACKKITGTHNFKSFTSDNEKDNYVRTIDYIKVKKHNNYVYIYIGASGFLKYMIRNIVGLLLEINEGKKSVNDIDFIFKSEDRTKNAITASPVGLYLNKINYKK